MPALDRPGLAISRNRGALKRELPFRLWGRNGRLVTKHNHGFRWAALRSPVNTPLTHERSLHTMWLDGVCKERM